VPPVLHDDPILSRSVQEFWGERWNRIVSAWLAANCLWPLARRRRPLLGLAAAFAASALLHAYLTWAALALPSAMEMGVFFLIQAVIVLFERRVGVPRWPGAAARAWTVATLLLTSPLFVGPFLELFDPLFV